MTYTGTLIKDLHSSVERAEQRATPEDERPEEFEAPDMDAILRRAADCPDVFLADAMTHLANKVMEVGDADAWFEMREAQDRLADEEEEDRNSRTIRTRLDLWLQSQAGC
jgi:hypothetical protein